MLKPCNGKGLIDGGALLWLRPPHLGRALSLRRRCRGRRRLRLRLGGVLLLPPVSRLLRLDLLPPTLLAAERRVPSERPNAWRGCTMSITFLFASKAYVGSVMTCERG